MDKNLKHKRALNPIKIGRIRNRVKNFQFKQEKVFLAKSLIPVQSLYTGYLVEVLLHYGFL